jgi:hypothetical protein
VAFEALNCLTRMDYCPDEIVFRCLLCDLIAVMDDEGVEPDHQIRHALLRSLSVDPHWALTGPVGPPLSLPLQAGEVWQFAQWRKLRRAGASLLLRSAVPVQIGGSPRVADGDGGSASSALARMLFGPGTSGSSSSGSTSCSGSSGGGGGGGGSSTSSSSLASIMLPTTPTLSLSSLPLSLPLTLPLSLTSSSASSSASSVLRESHSNGVNTPGRNNGNSNSTTGSSSGNINNNNGSSNSNHNHENSDGQQEVCPVTFWSANEAEGRLPQLCWDFRSPAASTSTTTATITTTITKKSVSGDENEGDVNSSGAIGDEGGEETGRERRACSDSDASQGGPRCNGHIVDSNGNGNGNGNEKGKGTGNGNGGQQCFDAVRAASRRLNRQVRHGEQTMQLVLPGLQIDLANPFGTRCTNSRCPSRTRVLSLSELLNGWAAQDVNRYTVRCPHCGTEFIPRFSVACPSQSASSTISSTTTTSTCDSSGDGGGGEKWLELLSPWTLHKETLTLILDHGVGALLSSELREDSRAIIFWNLLIALRLRGLPVAFLLTNGNIVDAFPPAPAPARGVQ